MDEGKRLACNAKFMELLPQRAELGNKRFRAEVRFYLIEEFDCTGAAASTHYNHSFKEVKLINPELVDGLGRKEGTNNGGRKKKGSVDTVLADSVAPDTSVIEVLELTTEAVVEEMLVNVYKKKDNSLVMLGVTLAVAEAAIAKAVSGKKAALVIA